MVYDTEDPTRIAQMNDEMRAIESMVIVGVLKYTAAGKEHGNWRDSAAGFGVTLRCHSARNHGACAKKAAGPVRLNSTFEEWDPASEADTSQEPVAMIINSSELRAAGFKLKEVLPPQLESAARGGMRTRGAGLRRLQGMGPQRFLLHVDDDTEFRSRCE